MKNADPSTELNADAQVSAQVSAQASQNASPTTSALPTGVQRVAAFLEQAGQSELLRMLSAAAHTAQQAADLLGVALGQIAKSIIFRRVADDAAVLIITAGDQRVAVKKLEAVVGAVARADADFVKSKTGFSIGGVSPFAHAETSVCLLDQTLLRFDTVWAAAGHPNAVFPITPSDLARLSGAPVIDITE